MKMGAAHLLANIFFVATLTIGCNAFLCPRQVKYSGKRIHDSRINKPSLGLRTQLSSSSLVGRAATYDIRFSSRVSGFDLDGSVDDRRRRRPSIGALQAASGAGSEQTEDLDDRTSIRRTVVLGLWIALVSYVAAIQFSLPGAPIETNSIGESLDLAQRLLSGESPLSNGVFSSVGVVAIMFAPILIGGGAFRGGKQVVPPLPFVFGGCALGFLLLGPYIALRNYIPEGDGEEAGLLEKLLTNKIFGLSLLAFSLTSVSMLVTGVADAAARQSYVEMFWNSALIHVSTIDLALMSLVIGDPIREDMRRRGWDPVPARIAPFVIPIVGPALWLVVRPPVVANADADRGA